MDCQVYETKTEPIKTYELGMSGNGTISLAVDLDEVVFAYIDGFREFLASRGITVPEEFPKIFSMDKAGWFKTIEEYRKTHGIAVDEGIYATLTPFEDASKILHELIKAGYEVNLVTSRFVNNKQHQKVLKQTSEALDMHDIPYSNIMFLSNKTRFLADTYIDDAPHNLEPLRDAGRHVIARTWAYNEYVEGVDRASNWTEIREILRNRYGK